MHRFTILVTIVLLVFATFSGYVKYQAHTQTGMAYQEGEIFQSFTRPTADGDTLDLDTVIAENDVIWVNFWASWCGPCRREMPIMADLYEKYHDQDFMVVAVNVREDKETITSFLSDNPQPYPIPMDREGALFDTLHARALPASFLLDGDGRVIQAGVGIQNNWERHIKDNL